MTKSHALKKAQGIWGKRALVEIRDNDAYIGQHGEYVTRHSRSASGQREDRYRCAQCSTSVVDEEKNLIETHVWHFVGSTQASYRVGTLDLGMFFSVRAEGDCFESCFDQLAKEKTARG